MAPAHSFGHEPTAKIALLGKAKTDLVRLQRSFEEGVLNDKFASWGAFIFDKDPIPERRKLLAKFTGKQGCVLNPL